MDINKVIEHFGGVSKTARALGLKQSSVSEWKVNGIPECREYQIELATNGKFRANKPALREEAA
jgi:DNA-binding transcriptional regulator YdaS (Cro superfamily)